MAVSFVNLGVVTPRYSRWGEILATATDAVNLN